MSKPTSPKTDAATKGLDSPRTIQLIVRALVVACVLLLLADLAYHKHSHFDFEGWFGFFPLFGFAAYCIIVVGAKQLRRLVMRDEDYYD